MLNGGALQASSRRLVRQVLSLPTAPFHEEAVAAFVQKWCRHIALPCRSDRFGNLEVHYKRGHTQNRITFLAHMDHPGLEVIRAKGREAVLGVLGGVPHEWMDHQPLLLWQNGREITGRVVRRLRRLWHRKPTFLAHLAEPVDRGAFGQIQFPKVQFRGTRIVTKGADDVINVAALLDFLKRLVQQRAIADVKVIFSRAEEVGWVGTYHHWRQGRFENRRPLIVLEASSARFGGIALGKGPVLRVGDKTSTFSCKIDAWLQEIGDALTRQGRFSYQRALLAGGTCEAGFLSLAGVRQVGCLALPLANYHNLGPGGPAPEIVDARDYEGMIRWLLEIAKAKPLSSIVRQRFHALQRRMRPWLKLRKEVSCGSSRPTSPRGAQAGLCPVFKISRGGGPGGG